MKIGLLGKLRYLCLALLSLRSASQRNVRSKEEGK